MANNIGTQAPMRTKTTPGSRTGLVVMGVGVFLLFMSLISIFKPGHNSEISPPRLNEKITDFELFSPEGKLIQSKDYRGYVILINTWATWCPPCRAEMPDLNAFYNQYTNEKFVVLAINAGEAPSLAADFSLDYGLDFPVLVDPDYRVVDAFKINSYPTSIVVDRDGTIRKIRIGVYTPDTLTKEVLPLILN